MSHFHGSQGQCRGKGVVNSESDGVTAAPPSLSWHRGSSEEAREPICDIKPSLLPGDRELLCPVPRGTRLDAVPYIEAGQTRRGKSIHPDGTISLSGCGVLCNPQTGSCSSFCLCYLMPQKS